MWSWEAKKQEWTDVTTNQGIPDLTGGPKVGQIAEHVSLQVDSEPRHSLI